MYGVVYTPPCSLLKIKSRKKLAILSFQHVIFYWNTKNDH